MPPLKATHISPTDEEEAAINAGIAADPDNPELDGEWLKRARPAIEVRPRFVKRWAIKRYLRTGDSSKLKAIGMWPLDERKLNEILDERKLRAIGMWPMDERKLKEIGDDRVLDEVWLLDDPVQQHGKDVTGSTPHSAAGVA